jgi:DNA-binding MarR family transcriptional regulator
VGVTGSRIQQEIGQTRPFRTPEQECLVGLLRTADVVRRRLVRVISPSGITLQQYNVLRILRGAGAEGMPTLEIGRRMIERAPGVTRLLERLVARHLVARGRTRADQRCVVCRITRDGLELLARLDAPVAAADRECLGELGRDEVPDLIQLLDAVRAGDSRQD